MRDSKRNSQKDKANYKAKIKAIDNSQKSEAKRKISKNNRVLITTVCIFLSVVLLAGIGFGIYFAVLETNTVVRYDNVRMDEGTVKVFAAYYKSRHLNTMKAAGYKNAADTERFWESLHENGKTQKEVYLEALESYISGIAAAANLYLSANRLSEADEEYIRSKTESFVSYYGSEDAFNAEAEKYGFDYDDMYNASELSYAANMAFYSIYGGSGEQLKSSSDYVSRLEEYLSKYTRVKIITIFTSGDIYDEEQKVERPPNESEARLRLQMIELLTEAINEGRMLEVTFDEYLSNKDNPNDGNIENGLAGYYFARGSYYTDNYQQPQIVDAALKLKVGESAAVEIENGWSFIYRCEPVSRAYTEESTPGLADFYQNAAYAFFAEDMEIISGEVTFKDKYYEMDLINIPATDRLFVTSWN